MIDGKIVHLTDGTELEVKVNFATIYYMQKIGLDKLIKKLDKTDKNGKKAKLSGGDSAEVAARMIYVILRSNGRKVEDLDDAMQLVPPDTDEIELLFEDFNEKMEKYKKKEKTKDSMNQMMK